MKTKKIGELLREQRESRRLTVEQVARLTHIKPEYLSHIEANEFEALPPAVYVKGYVRSLAHVYGVEPEPMLALLRRDYRESSAGVLVEQGDASRRRTALWRGPIKWPAIFIGAIFCTIAGYVLLQWIFAQQPPPLQVDDLASLTEIQATSVITGRSSPDVVVLVNDQPAALRPDGSFSYQLQLEQTGLVSIKVEARDQRGKSTIIERSVRVVQTESGQPAPAQP